MGLFFPGVFCATVLLALTALAGPAWAGHPSGELGVPGMSEKRLRSFEVEVLGPRHAREHARVRRAARLGELPRTTRRARSAGVRAFAAVDPNVGGRWGAPFSIPVMGIHAAVLPTGKVMWFSYPQNPSPVYGNPDAPNTAQAWLWDPATGGTKRVDPPLWRDPADGQLKPANIWCAGQTFTNDGRLVVFGGNLAYSAGSVSWKGLNKIYTFNPWSESWTEQPDMRDGRWYPTGVRTADGRIVIISGLDESGGPFGSSRNADVEVFTPSADLNGRGTLSLAGTLARIAGGRPLSTHVRDAVGSRDGCRALLGGQLPPQAALHQRGLG